MRSIITIPEMVFVTGTDTGAGKTWATLSLMHRLRSCGKQVMGMKPVASGCEEQLQACAMMMQSESGPLPQHCGITPW
jgi:Dethiobiotin synthetase